MRRVLSLLGRLVGVTVILGIPALLAYLNQAGFTAAQRAKVAEAIGGSALSVEIGRLTFNPFEGIVAEDVTVSQKMAGHLRLADIDKLLLSLNIADLLRGRVTIDLLDLEHATVSMPFAEDGAKPDVIELSDINADILNEGGRLTISKADFNLRGIHVSLSGELLNPREGMRSTPTAPVDPSARVAVIRSILKVFDEIRFAGQEPRLSVRVLGDLTDPSTISLPKVVLRAGGVDYRGVKFEEMTLRGSYANRVARILELSAEGNRTDIRLSGSWNFEERRGDLALAGDVDVGPVLRLVERGGLTDVLAFDEAPKLELHASLESGDSGLAVLATGDVQARNFSVKGVGIKSLTGAFAWKDSKLFVQDVVVESGTGTLRASAMFLPGDFRMKLDSDAIPTEFSPLCGPNERKVLDLMEFKDAPKVHLAVSGSRLDMNAIRGEGTIELGRTAMRDSWIDSAKSGIVFQDRAVLYRDFTVRKGGGEATGSFTYDFGRREVRLDKVRSGLNPSDVLMWVDPRVAATVAVYRFHSLPDVRADGLVHMENPSKNDLRIDVDAPDGLDYELLNKDLSFGATKGKVRLKGQKVLADVSSAELMDGDVSVDAEVSTDPGNPVFGATVKVARVDFPSLTKLYFGYSKSEGKMSGNYRFSARLRDPSSMTGEGSIRVEDGHVLAIPLFGPLSDIIGTIIPGAGHESARLATADFSIADRKVSSKNLEIEATGFEMLGEGDIAFPSGDLDLSMRINARGIPGLVLFPVSKLLEYTSTGTMSDPQWRPKIVPKEFFDILGIGGNPRQKPKTNRGMR